jgi:leader peptidase (prepilin peptidase)/N-methyltransferase
VELITGLLWAGFWWQNFVASWDPVRFGVMIVFSGILVACIFIDLSFYLLPDILNGLLLLLGLLYNIYLGFIDDPRAVVWWGNFPLPASVAGAWVGAGFFWVVAVGGRLLFGQDALGHGDIKLARGIGAVLFPAGALISFGLAIGLGAVLGALQVLARRWQQETEEGESMPPEPESLGSLLKCGLGYFLWVDALGMVLPRLERWWFGEETEEISDDWEPTLSTIPFGPYLAIGGLLTALWEATLMGYVEAYWRWVTGGT